MVNFWFPVRIGRESSAATVQSTTFTHGIGKPFETWLRGCVIAIPKQYTIDLNFAKSVGKQMERQPIAVSFHIAEAICRCKTREQGFFDLS